MGFYTDRDRLAGDSDNAWTHEADFDQDNLNFGEQDSGTSSLEDFAGPVDQGTVPGSQEPFGGGSTPGENPL